MTKSRPLDLWAVCEQCQDQFSLMLWVRPDPKNPEGLIGTLERSRDAVIEDGRPIHRCGGKLKVFGNVGTIRLEGN